MAATSSTPPPASGDREIDRRRFLKYVGAGSAAIFGASTSVGSLLQLACSGSVVTDPEAWVTRDGIARWRPPAYPVPLPGDEAPRESDPERLAEYQVRDDLVLPEGFRYEVLARWGDLLGPAGEPERQIRVGYNHDFTGLVPVPGSEEDFYLLVNHEYVAIRTWIDAYDEHYGEPPPELRLVADPENPYLYRRGVFSIDGWRLPLGDKVDLASAEARAQVPPETMATIRDLAYEILSQVGVSVLRVRRTPGGGLRVVEDAPDHRRITAYGRENVPGEAHEVAHFTGPAAFLFDVPPAGTMANCSGGTTPWGTFLTCEENFYNEVEEDVAPDGRLIESRRAYYGAKGDRVNDVYVFDHPTPPNVFGNGHALDEPLDGRHYGWVTEIEPASGHFRKHTALGRFRHENVAVRCERGKRLAAYMGDDRRGGHLWKYVSDEVVDDPANAANRRLLESGTLYVARFAEDFTGEWVPLEPSTPLRRPEPEHCFSAHVQVPARFVGGAVSVGDPERDRPDLEVEHWVSIVESFAGKPFAECTLGDLVTPEPGTDPEATEARKKGVILTDAFLMANACGGTPAARPEDIEVHPRDRTVYVAFTDATDGSTGSPDRRIFPDSERETSRQYGAIYRLLEGGVESAESDPAATTFTWGRFVSSGEVAAQGGGFACADNMVFDPQGNLWMMTDISTTVLNFPTSRRIVDGTLPGGRSFPGVFGNNALFMIPTAGPDAGVPRLFALAPMEAELCGPTFTDDGKTLILSVQHPGESSGTRRSEKPAEVKTYFVHDREGQPFAQRRTVPVGSNFPHGQLDRPPRPCVVAITRES